MTGVAAPADASGVGSSGGAHAGVGGTSGGEGLGLEVYRLAQAHRAADAGAALREALGVEVTRLRRSRVGGSHAVYLATLADGRRCAARFATHPEHDLARELWATERCRAAGVPAPSLLAADLAPGSGGAPATQAAQPIHGDYQETNLFFAGGRVSAIIDWEQPRLAPPAWEAVRALDFVFGFEPARCRRFLGAYRAARPLPLADLDAAAAAYDRYTCHSLWVYETLYLAGDRRVARFLQQEDAVPFVPVATRWARTREACAPE